jgi:hypothetical protein
LDRHPVDIVGINSGIGVNSNFYVIVIFSRRTWVEKQGGEDGLARSAGELPSKFRRNQISPFFPDSTVA